MLSLLTKNNRGWIHDFGGGKNLFSSSTNKPSGILSGDYGS